MDVPIVELSPAVPELPNELKAFSESTDIILKQCSRFASMGQLMSFAVWLISQHVSSKQEARRIAKRAIGYALETVKKDQKFKALLDEIYGGKYPEKSKEVWSSDGIAICPYEGLPDSLKTTFKSKRYVPLGKPSNSLLMKIAPSLHNLEEQETVDSEQISKKQKKSKLVSTRDVELIKKYERSAVAQSSLFEIDAQTRPTYGQSDKWRYGHGSLPVKIISTKLTQLNFSPATLSEFFTDMKSTFAFKDEESFANAVGYLIAPMIAHLTIGQNPGFNFSGPSRSGKGYLSRVLVELLYCRAGPPTVYSLMVPSSLYELANNLYGARDAIFLVFDEVARINPEQFKLLDNLLTEVLLKARKMRHGYISFKNLFTVAITSVHVNLTDETAGRFANIELISSRATEIETFHRKWHNRGPELLAALYHAINQVKIDPLTVPVVAHRRTGFAVLAFVLKEAFHLKTEFNYATNPSDYLQWACELYDSQQAKEKSGWREYSPTAFCKFLRSKKLKIIDDSSLDTAMRTILSGESTEVHPAYSEGYKAENDFKYQIKWRRHGSRTCLFVKKLDRADHISVINKN